MPKKIILNNHRITEEQIFTVGDLIERLSVFKPDLPVRVYSDFYDHAYLEPVFIETCFVDSSKVVVLSFL